MGKKFKILCVLIIYNFQIVCSGISPDSLQTLLNKAKHDTTRCNLLKALFYADDDPKNQLSVSLERLQLAEKNLLELNPDAPLYVFFMKQKAGCYGQLGYLNRNKGDLEAALADYTKGLECSKSIKNKRGMAIGLENVATVYYMMGDISKAYNTFNEGLLLSREVGDKEGEAAIYMQMARICNSRGDIPTAISSIQSALKLHEELGDKVGMASCFNNIGIIYFDRGEVKNALEYYLKSMTLNKEIGHMPGYSNALLNVGVAYNQLKEKSKAMEYMKKCLEVYGELGDELGKAWTLNQIGKMLVDEGDFLEAKTYYDQSMKIRIDKGDREGQTATLTNLGWLYFNLKDFKKALEYSVKSLQLSQELGYPSLIENASRLQYRIYKVTGFDKKALESFELFIQMRDSINSETTRKAAIRSQLKYEYEKQAAADSVAHAKETEIKDAELRKQEAEIKAKKNQQYALFGGLGLVMIFAGFMYNRFKVTQKQKAIIEKQKHQVEEQKQLVEEKQKEILDSIQYAKRIQLAQIPSEKNVELNLSRLKK